MKRFSVFHPFLFAVFPVLFLFSYNIGEVPAADIILPLLVVIFATAILFFALRLIIKNYIKAGIITTWFLVLFFSAGHVRDLISASEVGPLFRNIFIMGSLWALLFIVGAYLVIRSRRSFSVFTKFLNIVAVTLIVISLVSIGIYQVKASNLTSETTTEKPASMDLKDWDKSPDIYYIILDAYARQDVLEEIYGYDNSEFINYLTGRGFYVATNSYSNYCSTFNSMPCTLKMDYLTDEELENEAMRFEMWANSNVSRFLKERGYRYIVAGTVFEKGIGKYAEKLIRGQSISGLAFTDFTDSLIKTTALAPAMQFISALSGDMIRDSVLYAFDALSDIPNMKEPTFVYAHIISPHPPFIFDRDGNPVEGTGEEYTGEETREKYLDQLIFINKKVEILIDELLSKSEVPPVIILQSDHGVRDEYETGGIQGMQYKILNAYYFPEKDYDLLHESISPVNSFRIVFNLYFNTEYELLKDESR